METIRNKEVDRGVELNRNEFFANNAILIIEICPVTPGWVSGEPTV